MADSPRPIHPDDALAAFTDALLGGDEVDEALLGDDAELQALAATVVQLQQTLGSPEVDPLAARRMRVALTQAWQREPLTPPDPWWVRWQKALHSRWQSANGRRQVVAVAMLAAVLLLTLVGLPYMDGSSAQPGTAVGGSGLPPLILFGLLGSALLAWWFWSRRD